MFTLTVNDEQVYKELMDRVAERGASLDDVLRELLDRAENAAQEQTESPAEKLLKLIDATELPFDYALNARDAEDLLSRETGAVSWRPEEDDATS